MTKALTFKEDEAYIVLTFSTPDGLEELCEQAIREGYVPQGGIAVINHKSEKKDGVYMANAAFIQALWHPVKAKALVKKGPKEEANHECAPAHKTTAGGKPNLVVV